MKRLIFSIISLSTSLFAVFDSNDTIYTSLAPYNDVGALEGSYGVGYRVNLKQSLFNNLDISAHFCSKKYKEATYIFPNISLLSNIGRDSFVGFGAAYMKAKRNTHKTYIIAGYPLKATKKLDVNGLALSLSGGYNLRPYKALKAFIQYSAYLPMEIFVDTKFSKVTFITLSFNVGF